MNKTLILFILIGVTSCTKVELITTKNDYSNLFKIEVKNELTTIVTANEFGSKLSELRFSKPYQKVVLLNTTYLSYVKALGKEGSVVGITDCERVVSYYSEKDSAAFVVDCVGKNGVLNLELITALQPDLIVCNSYQQAELKAFKNIDFLIVNEFWEDHPLGRAEWVRVFGHLFGVSSKSTTIFAALNNSYRDQLATVEGQEVKQAKPNVYSLSRFSSNYFLPGCESLISRVLLDSKCEVYCIDSVSRSTEISQEQQMLACGEQDYLLFFDWLPNARSRKEVIAELGVENCFKGDVVYCNTTATNYFEGSIMEPDILIRNLYQVLYQNHVETKYFTLLKE
jgi:iron complex transport system substrate-binding protein